MAAQIYAPLTVATLGEVRRSMVDAIPVEVGAGPALATVVDIDAGGVPARLYRNDAALAPVILYAHGGGWVMGDLDTHDGLCRHLVAASGWAVLAVDYRRAPEHPYPAAIEDLSRALNWLRAEATARYGLDPHRIAVGGDSAGGLLAAVLARRFRDAGAGLAAQVLTGN
jgi:acetyl esterase